MAEPQLAQPPREPRRVPALHGLLWLQRGFRMFTAQPVRWAGILGLWLWATILLPALLTASLDYLDRMALIALQPIGLENIADVLIKGLEILASLPVILLFPLVFAGLMVGCQAAARGEPLRPGHLLAALERDPGRLVTVGGMNLIGQILMAAVIASLMHGRLANIDAASLSGPNADAVASEVLQRVAGMLPALVPVVILQTLLMAAMWFTPPLLAFHDMSALAAVRASVLACARNIGSLSVYAAAMMVMLFFVGAISLSVQDGGIVFGLIALLVLCATLTTVIGSVYVSYRDIFDLPID